MHFNLMHVGNRLTKNLNFYILTASVVYAKVVNDRYSMRKQLKEN